MILRIPDKSSRSGRVAHGSLATLKCTTIGDRRRSWGRTQTWQERPSRRRTADIPGSRHALHSANDILFPTTLFLESSCGRSRATWEYSSKRNDLPVLPNAVLLESQGGVRERVFSFPKTPSKTNLALCKNLGRNPDWQLLEFENVACRKQRSEDENDVNDESLRGRRASSPFLRIPCTSSCERALRGAF